MKVSELIRQLEDQNPDAEVSILYQPNWPMKAPVLGITNHGECADDDEDAEDEPETAEERVAKQLADGADPVKSHVYIVASEDRDYCPAGAWETLRR